jgi:c-di-GMP-binding flagellar brake protein YcgR
METLPMPLDALARQPAGLDEFRITSPREIAAMLRQLQDGSVMLNFNSSDGTTLQTMLWSIDSGAGMLSFNADANDPRTARLVDRDEAVVVGYLDSVKIQFDVSELVLVRGHGGSVLRCPMPRTLYRFQRRNAFRVRPLIGSSPTARLPHPDNAELQLALRVMDVSIGGCALFLPEDTPTIQPGTRLRRVDFALDADTRFQVDVQMMHLSAINAESKGARMGCAFVCAGAEIERQLQRFIDTTQKRRRMMAL